VIAIATPALTSIVAATRWFRNSNTAAAITSAITGKRGIHGNWTPARRMPVTSAIGSTPSAIGNK